MSRIGILTGTFDPVHEGHIAFALAAQKEAALDKIVFIIESQPRHKKDVTPLAHREAMLGLHTKQQPRFLVHKINQPTFDVSHTLPQLQKDFSDSELYLLVGEDVAAQLLDWPLAEELLSKVKVIVGLRMKTDVDVPFAHISVATSSSGLSSSRIREALKSGQKAAGIDDKVARYILENHLYDSSVTSK